MLIRRVKVLTWNFFLSNTQCHLIKVHKRLAQHLNQFDCELVGQLLIAKQVTYYNISQHSSAASSWAPIACLQIELGLRHEPSCSRVALIELLTRAAPSGYELLAHNPNLHRLIEYIRHLFLAVHQLLALTESWAQRVAWDRHYEHVVSGNAFVCGLLKSNEVLVEIQWVELLDEL